MGNNLIDNNTCLDNGVAPKRRQFINLINDVMTNFNWSVTRQASVVWSHFLCFMLTVSWLIPTTRRMIVGSNFLQYKAWERIKV